MRQVFSSQRIENVEGVARLLEEHGIQVRITNGRGWKGAIRGNFSYRDSDITSTAPKPAVWVVNSGDSPKARELLREAGLVKRERDLLDSYLPESVHDRQKPAGGKRRRPGLLKLGLLVLIGVAIGLGIRATRNQPPAAQVQSQPAPATTTSTATVPVVSGSEVHVIATPPALARTLVSQSTDTGNLVCLSVDGQDPDVALLDALREAGTTAQPRSTCTDADALRLAVSDYRTDGSGRGTVRITIERPGVAQETLDYDVERSGFDWRVEAATR